MDPHSIELPRKIVVGRGVLNNLHKVCEDIELIGRPLVIFGPHTRKMLEERIRALLEDNMVVDVAGEATYKEVERIESAGHDFECVISVGGGKVIDVGKMIASDKGLPFISVPTAPSHDGIASERVSLKNGNRPYSSRARVPVAVMADIDIIINAPYRLIASGAADIIANFTAVRDWQIAKDKGEYYSDYSSALSLLSAEIVSASAEMIRERMERGIRNLVEALISSGIAISLAGTSRPASGSEHSFSHALDMLGSKALHGEQCGVGAIISAYLQNQEWQAIKETLKKIGAPTTAMELGISKETVIKALVMAKDLRDRYTILNEIDMDERKAYDACKATGVI